MARFTPTLECSCDRAQLQRTFAYEAPPTGETRFELAGDYRRQYLRCHACGHWFGNHDLDLTHMYDGAYVSATYGDAMLRTFHRIMALPKEKSDNAGRAARVNAFAEGYLKGGARSRLLDIGSGLCVFAARMAELGWHCTVVDPDPAAVQHARQVVGVEAFQADFTTDDPELGQFDVISLNKVIEHVEAPVEMLRKAARRLAPHGFMYVEVPDADAAAVWGPGREEFFIEHHHVFSAASLVLAAERAGLQMLCVERLQEPSTKFTLRGFFAPSPSRAR